MNTRTLRPDVHRNARAKPPDAYGWIGKQPREPEDYGRTSAKTRRDPAALHGAREPPLGDALRRQRRRNWSLWAVAPRTRLGWQRRAAVATLRRLDGTTAPIV